MKMKSIGYWIATVLVALAMFSGGVALLVRQADNVKGMLHLGYPLYLMTILGIAKVLGAIAIVAPRLQRLKEWAYAGIFFDLVGAVASHAAVGDRSEIIAPAAFAALTLVSWALRPPGRVLGTLAVGGLSAR